MFYQTKYRVISCIEEKILTYKVTVIHLMQQVTLHLHVKKIKTDFLHGEK